MAQLTLWLGLLPAAAAFAWQAPPFPRVGGNFIGSPQNYENPAVQAQLARYDMSIILTWPGWQNGRGTTLEQVIKNIKAQNPNTLVFNYTLMESLNSSPGGTDVWSAERSALNNNHWWLYPAGTGGTPVVSGPSYVTNETLFTTTDSNGYHFVDWFANFIVKNIYAPAPSLDGIYSDNIFWKPRVDGDWNRDGITDSQNDPTVQSWLRQGERQYINDLRSAMPGKYQIGNLGDLGGAAAVFPELAGQLNGGFMEGLIGFSWSPETWGGWQTMMAAYRKEMAAVAAPQLAMFAQIGSITDYQSMRYGLASCLMDNAYYTFNSSANYSDLPWFDEYNANLGQATSPPSTSAWQKGVYRRDFANGIALVNPKGNGTQTVTLETSFRRLSGSQAPFVNNGQITQTVTLQDRDGIILLRLNAQPTSSTPAPPANVTVQ
ncbi:MAG: putative glycoside hydrolase [Steroidobacteraceae bacterium]